MTNVETGQYGPTEAVVRKMMDDYNQNPTAFKAELILPPLSMGTATNADTASRIASPVSTTPLN